MHEIDHVVFCRSPSPEVGYYGATCPDADAIVRQVMERRFYNDNTIAPAIIRMLFHDCFVTVRTCHRSGVAS
ncbi:Os04g0105850 [Oryza sativa Japonica Group]|uniref:Os04g0105850 protein n=1 Tax=Oryza sativa subsp. japonica TaxID=39947 RepID=A0A0N7KIG3_ORYSJ|nr:Os04g0105850 [Oryza sativa Japonica Group]